MNDINEYFKNTYLTCGNTYDNFIFEDCPIEFIELSYHSLKEDDNGVISCCIKLESKVSDALECSLNKCENEFQKKIVARSFFVSLFASEILKKTNNSDLFDTTILKNGICDILSGDFQKIKDYCLHKSPIPYDIKRVINKNIKIELNVFLIDVNNIYLQRTINNYISSREPYSVKLFSNKKLVSYVDEVGNLIENPHDYMYVDINKFINIDNKRG